MAFRLGCSIVQYNFAHTPFADALTNMAALGLKGIETYAPYPFEVARQRRTELRRLLEAHGLEPVTFLLGGYGIRSGVGSLADPDEQRLQTTLDNYRENILLAHENGFRKMVIFPGLEPATGDIAAAREKAARNLSVVADFAAEHGVEVLIETHAGALARDSHTFLYMREVSGSQNVYANVDPSNYLTVGDEVIAALHRLGNLVRGVHIKDVRRTPQGHYWTPAGEGEVDFAAFLAALKDIGYDGWLIVEYEAGISGKYYADPERGSRESAQHILSILQHL